MPFILVYLLILSRKPKFWYSETHSWTQTNRVTGSTLSTQNAKLQCCVQTTDRKGLGFFRLFRPTFPLSCGTNVLHARRSGKEHFECKNVQILVMKCANEMQFMQVK